MMRVVGAQRTVLLVHGAWHGGWCWERVGRLLADAEVPCVSVDNPSVVAAPSDLAADSENVRRVLDTIDGPVLLVGHSYGGAVVTDAGTHENVEALVYLAAFALDAGESVVENDLQGGEDTKLAEAVSFGDDLISVDPQRAVELFFHDCDQEVAECARGRLMPMSMAAMQDVTRSVAWREKPATYIVCSDDRALPVPLQMSNAARVGGEPLELATSHSPFLSQPAALAELLTELSR